MKIFLSQRNYKASGLGYNVDIITDEISRAEMDKCDLIVFPEYALSGTPIFDLVSDSSFMQRIDQFINKIAKSSKLNILIGFPYVESNKVYSAAAFISGGKIKKIIKKKHLSRAEMMFFTSSEGASNIEICGKNICVALGNDLSNLTKADIIINMSADSYYHNVVEERQLKVAKIACSSKSDVIFLNHIGASTDEIYDGSSFYMNKEGKVVKLLSSFKEDSALIDTDYSYSASEIKNTDKISFIYDVLILALKDYFHKNGFKDVCLGLSGGIDSAVVAALAAHALGAENVRGILMPSKFSSQHSIEDAVELAKNLGIRYDIVPINEMFDATQSTMKDIFESRPFDVAEENIQARLRCVIVMGVSNKFGCLALNTSNKSEAAMGYGTLYGDTSGALSILADLYKTEVYELAKYINRKEEIIPLNTIQKPPSAELREGQKDSDSLPDYDTLDAILYKLIEDNQSVEQIIEQGFDPAVVIRIAKAVYANEYKRFQLPPVIRLSRRTLGYDRIMPFGYRLP